jgi:hypothetical protein
MSSALEAILGGAPAAAGGADAPPAIPDPEPHLATPDSGAASGDSAPVAAPPSGGDEVSTLQDLLGLTRQYLEIGSVQPDEAVKMKKVELIVHELLAANQKQQDSVSGANPALRKVLASGG